MDPITYFMSLGPWEQAAFSAAGAAAFCYGLFRFSERYPETKDPAIEAYDAASKTPGYSPYPENQF